jgi:ribosome biogenesis GTPase / thiamine phosphate phosphatase
MRASFVFVSVLLAALGSASDGKLRSSYPPSANRPWAGEYKSRFVAFLLPFFIAPVEGPPALPTREEIMWKHHAESKTLRGVRKQIKRNRQPDDVRRRDWLPGDIENLDAFYDMDVPDHQPVMPRGERERRKTTMNSALAAIGDDAETETIPAPLVAATAAAADADEIQLSGDAVEVQGTVVEVSTGLCRVELPGRTLLCGLRGALTATDTGFTNVVAVGDEVIVAVDGTERGVVEAVLPRRSALTRPDVFYHHLQQIIAANVEQLLIVAAWREPAFWPELADRYLVTAERNRLSPILCVNKIDLAEDLAACRTQLQPYLKLGYRVIFASALTGAGIDELRQTLYGRSTVLAGLSGVGKSSLLSAIQPGLDLRTHEVSDRRHEGRHTTTQATLLKLDAGGYVVDTPGIREFGLGGLPRRELARFYREIALGGEHCAFNDCSHVAEPGCAVRTLVRAGWISPMRYDSYKKILESL